MVIDQITKAEVQEFIYAHELDDESRLVLKHKEILGVPSSVVANQIVGRRKAKEKLPLFYRTPNIVFPPALNLEQCSSEMTATFKASLVAKGNVMIDLTGGFGIDSFFFSASFDTVHYVEPDDFLVAVTRHNHKLLGAGNIVHHAATAESFTRQFNAVADFIFIDPSRRTSQGRIVAFSECQPDVTAMQMDLLRIAPVVMVKASPMMDIAHASKVLHHLQHVYVVSVDNEVKELLFVCSRNHSKGFTIGCIDLGKNILHDLITFDPQEERSIDVQFSDPRKYIYEPSAAIMKAGAFNSIAWRYSLKKVHQNTHFYTGELLNENFPGRIFSMETSLKPDPKTLKKYVPDGKANVITRNYPLSPDALKRKAGLKDGGNKYVLAFTSSNEKKIVMLAERVK